MSTLTDIDKRYLEKILDMGGGYVSDYSDATFREFFRRHKIDIHTVKYQTYGTSKAKKMRAFCVFRSKPITDSGRSRSLIPVQTDH